MRDSVVLLSVPGLRGRGRRRDRQPPLDHGRRRDRRPDAEFPCVTCPVRAAMATGDRLGHGVVANGFIGVSVALPRCGPRPTTASSATGSPLPRGLENGRLVPAPRQGLPGGLRLHAGVIPQPRRRVALVLHASRTTCTARSATSWAISPASFPGGPAAGVASSRWIADSAVHAATLAEPVPGLPPAPRLCRPAGDPDSSAAQQAVAELSTNWSAHFRAAGRKPYGRPALARGRRICNHAGRPVSYPNRVLREAGLLAIRDAGDGEQMPFENSPAWAMVDHQFSHVFVQDRDAATIRRSPGVSPPAEIAEVLAGEDLKNHELDHARSGELVLISAPSSWRSTAGGLTRSSPAARPHDRHPSQAGLRPVELHFSPATRSIPLDAASLVKGSHGA